MKMETVKLSEAYGKCLAEDIYAEENIPDFRRATVDGYAVKASDTQGAGESVPVFLSVVDEISIGKPALREIKNGECAYVPTGGMIPDGADAMVMVEYTELFDKRDAAVYSSVSAGNGVVQIGEDAKRRAPSFQGNRASFCADRCSCLSWKAYGKGLCTVAYHHHFYWR